ncbi:hypothetical protein NA57DRAFT_58607 [Rhizodiscina lignyota]|uniref:Uncharacterized protein n=1 Tax=Rhizodiscina lignyota TaxID=1504668 RepID=A0A9P4I807_9PEZI|nr:hypothetical protein NA57DRAFT_58607 [Rhizodiscina lignyota]
MAPNGKREGEAFTWVNSTSARIPEDAQTRTQIRRQAMRNVAIVRKRTGIRRNRNTRQYPIFMTDAVASEPEGSNDLLPVPRRANSHEEDTGEHPWQAWSMQESREVLSAFSNPENLVIDLDLLQSQTVKIQYRFDLQELSELLEQPSKVSSFMGRKSPSYRAYFQSQYGRSACLTDAADALIVLLQGISKSGSFRGGYLSLESYGRALESLQRALNTPGEVTPDILCATELLTLYEVGFRRLTFWRFILTSNAQHISPQSENAWTSHASGAASLMCMRGPDAYVTDLEKSLFMSNVGPVMVKALLIDEACFLERPEWAEFMRSMMDDNNSPPERTKIVLSLYLLISRVPRLFKDIGSSYYNDTDMDPVIHRELLSRATRLRIELRGWREDHFDVHLKPMCGGPETDGYCKLLIFFFHCSILANRCVAALSWADPAEVDTLEEETYRWACTILTMIGTNDKVYANLQGAFYMSHKIRMAESVLSTHTDWQSDAINSGIGHDIPQKVISKEKFQRWCEAFGRKVN